MLDRLLWIIVRGRSRAPRLGENGSTNSGRARASWIRAVWDAVSTPWEALGSCVNASPDTTRLEIMTGIDGAGGGTVASDCAVLATVGVAGWTPASWGTLPSASIKK